MIDVSNFFVCLWNPLENEYVAFWNEAPIIKQSVDGLDNKRSRMPYSLNKLPIQEAKEIDVIAMTVS